VESLDKASKAAAAPRSKLDAGLTDFSKRVEALKLAVAKVPPAVPPGSSGVLVPPTPDLVKENLDLCWRGGDRQPSGTNPPYKKKIAFLGKAGDRQARAHRARGESPTCELISHSVLIKWFWKANSSTKPSTCCFD
jgi:hypothetical protein